MLVEDIKKYCISKYKACEEYPFGDVPICYKLNGKIFAQVYLFCFEFFYHYHLQGDFL